MLDLNADFGLVFSGLCGYIVDVVSARYKMVSCRLPADLKARLDNLVQVSHLSRTKLLEIALRVLIQQAKRRGRNVTLPYSAHFAAEELAHVNRLIAEHEGS